MDQYIQKIIKAKDTISIFRNMEDDDIRKVVKDVKFIHFEPNESIIRKGEDSKEIYLLVEGECEVIYDGKIVATILEKEPFGEFAPITHEKRTATVRAKNNVKVIAFKLNIELMEKALKGYSILYKNFTDELIKKLEISNKR